VKIHRIADEVTPEGHRILLVDEADLLELELLTEVPLHQQISRLKKIANGALAEDHNGYPVGVFLVNLVRALEIAESLALTVHAQGLRVERV
jgi:hypothetical protein